MLVFFSLGKVQSEFWGGGGGGGGWGGGGGGGGGGEGGGFRVEDFLWFLPLGEGERGIHFPKVKANVSLLH